MPFVFVSQTPAQLQVQAKVYNEIVPDASKATLQKVIRGRIMVESVINTDGWRGYGLVGMGFTKHFRVHHGDNEFVRGMQHINSIESFWSYAKHRLVQFNGGAEAYLLPAFKRNRGFASTTDIMICIKYY